MKKITPILIALVLVGAGCFSSAPVSQDQVSPNVEELQGTTQVVPVSGREDVVEKTVEEEPASQSPQTRKQALEKLSSGDSIKITMVAKQWKFEPSTIKVKLGQRVDMQIMSIDVTHGFSLPTFGINERLEPGKMTSFSFVANKKGTYSFACSVQCGSGHATMVGTLIVE